LELDHLEPTRLAAHHNLAELVANLSLAPVKLHLLLAMTHMQTSTSIFQKSRRQRSHQSHLSKEQKRKKPRIKKNQL
jgi:hypothetical protein